MRMRKKGTIFSILTLIGILAAFAGLIVLLVRYRLDSLGRLSVVQEGMDMLALSLGIILYLICMMDRDSFTGLKRRFLFLLVLVYAATFADAAVWITEGHQELRILSIVLDTLLFAAIPPTSYAFFSYVMEYLGIREKKSTKILSVLMLSGAIVAVVICIINIFHPIYFSIDQWGIYHREAYHQWSDLYAYFAGAVTIVVILINAKRIRAYQSAILISFVLAPVFALFVDQLFYGLTPACAVMLTVLSILYVVLNVEKSRAQSAVESELKTATSLQKAMLPNLLPEATDTAEYDLFASMNPAREVGGDFYDYFMLDDHTLAFLIADVSDKGMGAALFMAVSKAMIKMRAQAGGSPAEVIRDVDAKLGKDNDLGMFVTVWLGYLDLTTGHVVACNAGHDFPALSLRSDERSKGGTYFVEESEHGPAVGLIPGMEFPEIEFDMEPGDKIFLYTDGVNEAQGKDAVQFDIDRLLAVLNENREKRSEEICCQVKEAVDAFVGKDPQFDDMTMMALAFRGYRREGLRMTGSILVDASEDALDEINEFLGGKLSETSFDPNVQFQLELAVEEIFVNIFSYAYEDPDEEMKASPLFGKVEVSCEIQSEPAEITLSFRDGGRAFNPLEAQEADTSGEMFLEKEGGFGIHMVKETMDEVTYERKDGANVLTIRKKL